MNQTDPIADLLTRIRNANSALKSETSIPYSRLKGEVTKVLKRTATSPTSTWRNKKGPAAFEDSAQDCRKERSIVGIKRISRPGLRRYAASDEMPRVLGGMGISIVTTSRGVMTGHEARKAKVGGEILAYVW